MDPCVTFVTGNHNKLREVKAILEPTIRIQSTALDLDEIQGTIDDVTEYKCHKAADLVNGPVLVEDTALCFHALGELPGPYIKWFLSAIGLEGLNNLLAAYTDKSADAVCTFGYSPGPGQKPLLFQGRCPGNIVPSRGPSHFGRIVGAAPDFPRWCFLHALQMTPNCRCLGWDPIFEFRGQTFAEMNGAQKNAISHRARALKLLQDWFKNHPDAFL